MKNIELNNVVERGRPTWRQRFRKWLFLGIAFGVLSFYAAHYLRIAGQYFAAEWDKAIGWIVTEAVAVEPVRVLVEPHAVGNEELIHAIATEQGVSPILIAAIITKESSGGKFLYAFEPRIAERISTMDRGRFANRSENEKRMLSSSHGLMHVMGWVAESVCGIPWSDLYDRAKNLRCGIQVLQSGVRDGMSLRQVLAAYNGSGPAATDYADKVLAIITEMNIGDLSKGVL